MLNSRYYVMSSKKFSDVLVFTSYSPQRLSASLFLEKWKESS